MAAPGPARLPMVRAKRSSALRARTTVQGLSSTFSFLDDPEEAAKKESEPEPEPESEAEVVSVSSESSEKEDSLGESGEDLGLDEELDEDGDEDGEEAGVKPKIGRPRKGTRPPRAKGTPKYVKVTEYSLYSPGPHPISVWKKAIAGVRRIKWGGKRKKGVEKFKRPPTDLLTLKTSLPVGSGLPRALHGYLSRVEPIGREELMTSSSVEFTFQDIEGSLSGLESKTVAGAVFAKAGCGAVTGMDWCRCCCKLLATSSYPSADYMDYLIESTPISSEIVIWKLEAQKNFAISPVLILKHSFGVARQLKWYPFQEKNVPFLAASFGDKTCRIIHVPARDTLAVAHLTSSDVISFENASCFSWGHSPDQFITGSFDGQVTFWALSDDAPKRIFSTRIGQKPIFTISPCPDNPNLFAVGGYEKHAFVLDISNPFDLHRHFSSISTGKFIFAGYFISVQMLFPMCFGAQMDIALSTQHNVVAASSSDGSVHFFLIQSHRKGEKFHTIEYGLIKHRAEAGGRPAFTRDLIYDPRTTTYTMHDLVTSATRLAWCTSPEAPGVLAVGTGSGMIMLQALDEYLLVQEGRA